MSRNSTSCPQCGSNDKDVLEAIDTQICDRCSFVLDADFPDGFDIEPALINESDSSTNPPAWDDEVTIQDKAEQNLVEMLQELEECCSALELPKETELESAEIAAQAWEDNFMHGRSVSVVLGAGIYAASLMTGNGVPPGAVGQVIDVNKNKLTRVYRILRRELELTIPPAQPSDYVHYICEKQGLADGEIEETNRLLNQSDILGGNPIGIACAAVYLAATKRGEEVTLRELAKTGHLTKETVWNHKQTLSG